MAAALLMMNMQGAVMAADKDLTIFRYSDKVPFALMTDPKSRLKWDEIWENFRSMASINEEDTFDQRVTVFDNFLSKYLSNNDLFHYDNELTYKLICVGYDPMDMFPRAAIFKMHETQNRLNIHPIGGPIIIDCQHKVFYQSTSKSANLKILFGGMSSKLADALQDEMARQLAETLETEKYEIKQSETFLEVYYSEIDDIEKDPQVDDALRLLTIKDLVAIEENMIDIENLNHSSTTALGGTYTREIATLTLAEGFKWIKHSLYGSSL